MKRSQRLFFISCSCRIEVAFQKTTCEGKSLICREFLWILAAMRPNSTASGSDRVEFDLETCISSSCVKELRRFGGRGEGQAVRGGTGSHSLQLTCPGIKRDLERLQSVLSCSCSSMQSLVCSASLERFSRRHR